MTAHEWGPVFDDDGRAKCATCGRSPNVGTCPRCGETVEEYVVGHGSLGGPWCDWRPEATECPGVSQ